MIYFACQYEDRQCCLVKLDYVFKLSSSNSLLAQQLNFRAAVSNTEQSLAELLLTHHQGVETVLDWKERLCLGNEVISFRLEKHKQYNPHKKWTLHISRT